jgi:hypothetical protein
MQAPSPRVVYIGAFGRSGSTILDIALGLASKCVAVGELIHVVDRGVMGNELCGCGKPFHDCDFWTSVGKAAFGSWSAIDAEAIVRMQGRVARFRHIPVLVAQREPSRDGRAYLAFLEELYGAVARVAGNRVVIDSSKDPAPVFLLRASQCIDLRVLHLVRDSRGVAYSWTKAVRRPEIIGRVAEMPRFSSGYVSARWNAFNLSFHLAAGLGVRTARIEYEAFARSPLSCLNRALEQLDMEPMGLPGSLAEGFVDVDVQHTVSGNPIRLTRNSHRIEIRVDDEWRSRLPKNERRVVTLMTAPLLRAYGYPLLLSASPG